VAKRLHPEKKLEEDNANRPDVYLRSYVGVILVEAFGCLIPVCTYALRGQLYLLLSLIKCLTKAKVSNFDFSVVKDYILRLQIVVDNSLLLVI
jgi:hypothetical protein